MSTNDSNDWVKEGTPREEWDADTDYGVEVTPSEWDDYSEEQAVPVPTPAAAMDYQPPAPEPELEPEPDFAEEREPEVYDEPGPAPERAAEPDWEPAPDPVVDHEPDADPVVEYEPDADPVVEDDPDATTQHAAAVDETAPEFAPTADDAPAVEAEQQAAPEEDPDATVEHAAVGAAPAAAMGGLYRQDLPSGDETRVIDQSPLEREQAAEEERLARLQEQRDARDARLGVVPGSDANDVRVITKPVKRQSDRFFGAFSLFVLRLITAALIGVLGFQVLQDIDASEAFLATTVIPEPRITAWILGSVLIASAFLLVIGLGVRIVGVLLLAISIASLATIRWGAFSIFMDNMEGFLGDRTLLTAAVALILVAFGGGGWSIDGAIRGAREESKAARND
ncbi:MAG: DoxX family membrane protein [Propionibacterium sp.]|nr:DoxX family membrane protein [Propionibacterium sp.]